jgi:hypothetical protein
MAAVAFMKFCLCSRSSNRNKGQQQYQNPGKPGFINQHFCLMPRNDQRILEMLFFTVSCFVFMILLTAV